MTDARRLGELRHLLGARATEWTDAAAAAIEAARTELQVRETHARQHLDIVSQAVDRLNQLDARLASINVRLTAANGAVVSISAPRQRLQRELDALASYVHDTEVATVAAERQLAARFAQLDAERTAFRDLMAQPAPLRPQNEPAPVWPTRHTVDQLSEEARRTELRHLSATDAVGWVTAASVELREAQRRFAEAIESQSATTAERAAITAALDELQAMIDEQRLPMARAVVEWSTELNRVADAQGNIDRAAAALAAAVATAFDTQHAMTLAVVS